MPDPTTVLKKYEGIYGACAELIRQVLSVDTVSNDERYAYLQRAVPAIWAAMVHSEFPLKSDEALANCISDYENAKCRLQTLDGISETSLGHVEQWKSQWISKSLSRIDFD